MVRLPTPGGDDGDWGDILNSFLTITHAADGTLSSNVVGSGQIQAGAVSTNKLANNAVTNAQLDSTTQTSLAKANSAVQTVNSKTPASGSLTLNIADLADVSNGTSAGNNQVLAYNTTTSKWTPATVTSSGSVSDATTTSKGVIQLTSDLGGTATAPIVNSVLSGHTPEHTDNKAVANGYASLDANSNVPASQLGNSSLLNIPTISVIASRNLVITDNGSLLFPSSATNMTVTIPLHSSVALPSGAMITFLNINSSQTFTVAPAGGVTLNNGSSSGSMTVGLNVFLSIFNLAGNDTWYVVGG